ncbi:MAG: hypothetical protein DHS20C01_12300 [marine bacterium B5-7]|nr:MAG: hypothetical protein DHS20C01_12300 [marine bacterium B5-7]
MATSSSANKVRSEQLGEYQLLSNVAKQDLCRILTAFKQTPDNKSVYFLKVPDESAEITHANGRLTNESIILRRLGNAFLMSTPEEHDLDGKVVLNWPYRNGVSLAEILFAQRSGKSDLELNTKIWIVATILRAMNEIEAVTDDKQSMSFVILGSPDSLWVTDNGELFSIGLADIITTDSSTVSTLWSPMTAPERIVEGRVIDRRADIFAVGALLFHLLTLRTLISDNTLNSNIVYRLFRNVHPKPSDVNKDLAEFDPIVEKAVRWLPEHRFQTADEFLHAMPDSPMSATDSIREDLHKACLLALAARSSGRSNRPSPQRMLVDDKMDPQRVTL